MPAAAPALTASRSSRFSCCSPPAASARRAPSAGSSSPLRRPASARCSQRWRPSTAHRPAQAAGQGAGQGEGHEHPAGLQPGGRLPFETAAAAGNKGGRPRHSRWSARQAMEARQAPRCTIGASTPCTAAPRGIVSISRRLSPRRSQQRAASCEDSCSMRPANVCLSGARPTRWPCTAAEPLPQRFTSRNEPTGRRREVHAHQAERGAQRRHAAAPLDRKHQGREEAAHSVAVKHSHHPARPGSWLCQAVRNLRPHARVCLIFSASSGCHGLRRPAPSTRQTQPRQVGSHNKRRVHAPGDAAAGCARRVCLHSPRRAQHQAAADGQLRSIGLPRNSQGSSQRFGLRHAALLGTREGKMQSYKAGPAGTPLSAVPHWRAPKSPGAGWQCRTAAVWRSSSPPASQWRPARQRLWRRWRRLPALCLPA